MAINWMDNFNIYGTDAGRDARLLNGVYAEASGVDLIVDPDPTAGGGRVLQVQPNATSVIRKVLATARTTVGVLARYWLDALPDSINRRPRYASVTDINNNVHCFVTIDPSGVIEVYRQDAAGAVLIGSTTTPVIVANAWQHVETKFFLDAAAGVVTVRVEGVQVLATVAGRTTTNVGGAVASAMNVSLRNVVAGSTSGAPSMNVKDFIVWDNTTGFNNDFMGSCQVLKIIPDADVALNWTPSSGLTGFNLINEVSPDDDVNYISAPAPGIPAAYKCSLSDLPPTVTSVRGVMPIHRSRKTDGGDGNIQIGVISGASTGLGSDRAITTAYSYWYDLFDADPATAAAWTRVSVNAVNLQINRTL